MESDLGDLSDLKRQQGCTKIASENSRGKHYHSQWSLTGGRDE